MKAPDLMAGEQLYAMGRQLNFRRFYDFGT